MRKWDEAKARKPERVDLRGPAQERGDARTTVHETDTGGRRREPRGKGELL